MSPRQVRGEFIGHLRGMGCGRGWFMTSKSAELSWVAETQTSRRTLGGKEWGEDGEKLLRAARCLKILQGACALDAAASARCGVLTWASCP